jgi:hypothetical protein
LERLPQLQLDNREIVDARLASVSELNSLSLTGPVAAYVRRSLLADRAEGAVEGSMA